MPYFGQTQLVEPMPRSRSTSASTSCYMFREKKYFKPVFECIYEQIELYHVAFIIISSSE
jgi:hypothetical protein